MKLDRKNIQYLIIHQSATLREQTTFEKIKKFHLYQGMGNIAYHYFIESNGRTRKGRNESTAGTHTKASNMNTKSLGICLAGDFNKENPTKEQLQALERLIVQLIEKFSIPINNILGHREVPGSVTECPGDNLNKWLVSLRKKLKNKKSR